MGRRALVVRRRRVGYQRPLVETRSVYKQPFLTSSVWNTPIGSGAVLVDAGLAATTLASGRVTADPIHLGMDPAAPLKELGTATTVVRADGTVSTVTPGYTIPAGTMVRVPPTVAHNGSYNGISAFVMADGIHYMSGQALHLAAGGSPSWAFTRPQPSGSLYDDGREGIHGGSRLGGLGGTLRAWEWYDTGPIRHVLAINLYGIRFLSTTTNGWRWPAYVADAEYNDSATQNYYGRTGTGFDGMKMGSLLALPPSFNMDTLATAQARRVATCLRDFGGYVVDNTKRDVHAISVENSVVPDWDGHGTAFHADLMGVFTALNLVNNSASTAVGGGGTPRVAAVPDVA